MRHVACTNKKCDNLGALYSDAHGDPPCPLCGEPMSEAPAPPPTTTTEE